MSIQSIGISQIRTDARDKISGKTRYLDDIKSVGGLHARVLTSTHAHANILNIDLSGAYQTPGVSRILTGCDSLVMTGSEIQDMPVLARDVVRYYGEPVALVIAAEEWQAFAALNRIKVAYEPLTPVNSVAESLAADAPLIHPRMGLYKRTAPDIKIKPGTNIVNHVKVRKGDMSAGWGESDVVVDGHFSLPRASHVYMETRCAEAEISDDGTIFIASATQAPHATREFIAQYFNLSEGSVVVSTGYVGGAYGGKVCPHPEMLAYIASRAVGGKKVSLVFTREQCFMACGSKIGAECDFKLGVKKSGIITALEAVYHLDTGGYADTGPRMTVAIAANCSGPYDIRNIQCDALCIYTNHVYATSFRGFGHEVSAFCIERMIEKAARAIGMDAVEIRMLNLAREGSFSPTRVALNDSNFGKPTLCLEKIKQKLGWSEGACIRIGENKLRAKGVACFCKTSSLPTDTSSGAVITFCSDGSINVNCGAVEMGQGVLTVLKQLAAERLRQDPERIHVNDRINTRCSPEHWKTVASMTTYLVGKAVLEAAEDAVRQLKKIASVVLRCSEDVVDIGRDKVFLVHDPSVYVPIKDIAAGIKFENGNAYGGQIIGRGSYTMPHLSQMDAETGQGRTGPYWTTGAQGVEIEYDTKEHQLRLIRAVTVIDAGRVLNPDLARAQVMGAMSMGVGIATREAYAYNDDGRLQNSSLRTYKVMHFAQNPLYEVEFIETPSISSPYGARGLAEHGVLGMMPALANAVSAATGAEADAMPLKFETLWKLSQTGEGQP